MELERVLGTFWKSDLLGITQPVGNNRSEIRMEVPYSQSSASAISPLPWAVSPCQLVLILVCGPRVSYSPIAWHCTILLPGTANRVSGAMPSLF